MAWMQLNFPPLKKQLLLKRMDTLMSSSAGGRNTWIGREVLKQSNIIKFCRDSIDLSQWAAIDTFKELCVRACLSRHRWAQSVI